MFQRASVGSLSQRFYDCLRALGNSPYCVCLGLLIRYIAETVFNAICYLT